MLFNFRLGFSLGWVAIVALVLITGCGPSTDSATVDTTISPPSADAPAAAKTVVEFWTTDTQPDRLQAYQAVAQRFMAAHVGVELQIVAKDEATVSSELETAAAENRLPALVRIGVERLPGLAVENLLDEQAASAVIRTVGIDDFRAGPLEMVTNLESQQQWAIPYDGWIQAMWYRKDLFDAQMLAAPATWDQINAACDALAASPDVEFALALPSDPTQNYVHQVFEQIAMSNQAWPLTPEGAVAFNTPEMIAALRFYTELQRCSAPAPLTAVQAANHYLRGEVAMLFYSTYIMDDLVEGAQRSDGSVTMPSLEDLAKRTSFASGMVGPNGSAAYGQVVALAILKAGDPKVTEGAKEVAKFFLTDGYTDILATAPLGKIPVRLRVAERWTELSPLFANYSPATLGHIANGFDTIHRWVLRPDYSNEERAVVSEIESRLLIPQAIDNILRGQMTPESAAAWLQQEVEALVAQ